MDLEDEASLQDEMNRALQRLDRNRVGRPHSERATWETIEKLTNIEEGN